MPSIPNPDDSWTSDDARRLFDEHRRQGGSLAAFARRHGVTSARLYWWKKRLSNESPSLNALSLVPATVISAEAAPVTIRMPNGIAIELTTTTTETVAALVAELTRSLT